MKKTFDDISNSTISMLVDEYVHNPTYRDILKDRLCNGVVYEDLAEKYNYSVRHIKRIVYKCEEKLFSKISIQ